MCVRIGVRSGIGCLNNIPGMLLLHWIGLDREESGGWLRLGGGREENGNSKKAGVRHHKTEQSPSAGSECSGSEASEGVEEKRGQSILLAVGSSKPQAKVGPGGSFLSLSLGALRVQASTCASLGSLASALVNAGECWSATLSKL